MKNILYLTILFIVVSCSNESSHESNKVLNKITLSFDLCFGCTFSEDIEIDSNGNIIVLTDRLSGDKRKYYHGKLNKMQFDSINTFFQRLRFERLNSIYPKILDERTYNILIDYELNGDIKNRFFTGCEMDKQLVDLTNYIMQISVQTELVQVNEMHFFDTYQICDKPPHPTNNTEIISIIEDDQ